jgi:hypothetical protein
MKRKSIKNNSKLCVEWTEQVGKKKYPKSRVTRAFFPQFFSKTKIETMAP